MKNMAKSIPNQPWKVICLLSLVCLLGTGSAQAQTRLVVRDSLGLPGIKLTCLLLRCNVVEGLGDPQGQLFVVTLPSILNPVTSILRLNLQLGIVGVEIDQTITSHDSSAGVAPSYLTDRTLTNYYGANVWHGYLVQPGNQLIGTSTTQSKFGVTGQGTTVAVIDTGVDPTHPALAGVLVSGYDFTRNVPGGSELPDVDSAPDPSDDTEAAVVSQRTVAVLDQRTVAVLDGSGYEAFGHGTMTAGLVHLVAPQAKIMPLKAFSAAGTGNESDILRAIYYAVQNGADVMNMSFDFPTYSKEIATAIKYAQSNGVIAVTSAGNDGKYEFVYPGALPGVVNVASTSNQDIQSTFTNYGTPPVYMSAPGEGVMTLYPWGTYAAGWGTSFSTPLVSGTAALMLGANGHCRSSAVASGLAHAQLTYNPQLGWGRLNTYAAVKSCQGLF